MDDLEDCPVGDPPSPLLPLLTVEEAQSVVEVLGAVAAGGAVDVELAVVLLSNLAARVPSRAESSLGAAEAELLKAAAPFGPPHRFQTRCTRRSISSAGPPL
ncbi:hypothetical protein IM697_18510 [Streptomyces ferrugineus]|uniref:Uncharacterized protein n=1 Tax=Streptomyces ferrugineus TaxID=1413221 RepID=A0A7M2SX48_9ACTN|nr:hypothetical protein [Streptomyces ferrugineus]QOV40215.1 hypothetical protein IM697_18510 [Streptomyces ferrugineus]